MILLLETLYGTACMDASNREGRAFGESNQKKVLTPTTTHENTLLAEARELRHNETPNETTPLESNTRFMLNARTTNKSDPMSTDKMVNDMITKGDKIVNDPKAPIHITSLQPSTTQDEVHTCIESKTIPTKFFHRTLQIEYDHHSEEKEYVSNQHKRCIGGDHHPDDHPNCTYYEWYDRGGYYRTVRSEYTTLRGEHWEVEDPNNLLALIKSNQANILQTICTEGPSTKTFYTLSIYKPCWRQKIIVSLPEARENTCLQWRQRGCTLISEQCLHYAEDGSCNTYQKRYRCPKRTPATVTMGGDGIHCIDGGTLVAKSPPFNDAAQALTQLAALSEMQKELDAQNLKNPMVFKGERKCCKKNVLADLLYDCCQTKAGFAITLGLTNCNTEERQLGELREQGRCHYVGAIQNEFIAWKSSDTHVYCCYPSKLIAVLQEEARKQLNKTFGTPDNPDCNGLSMEDIARLDFSKMDLSALFDDIIFNKAKTDPLKNVKTPTQAHIQEKMKSLKIPEKS